MGRQGALALIGKPKGAEGFVALPIINAAVKNEVIFYGNKRATVIFMCIFGFR